MSKNNNFEKEIANAGLKKNDHIYFLCRSGQRSLEAANHMIKKGYDYRYNITDGFEGDKNSRNRRSTINGWKFIMEWGSEIPFKKSGQNLNVYRFENRFGSSQNWDIRLSYLKLQAEEISTSINIFW